MINEHQCLKNPKGLLLQKCINISTKQGTFERMFFAVLICKPKWCPISSRFHDDVRGDTNDNSTLNIRKYNDRLSWISDRLISPKVNSFDDLKKYIST